MYQLKVEKKVTCVHVFVLMFTLGHQQGYWKWLRTVSASDGTIMSRTEDVLYIIEMQY